MTLKLYMDEQVPQGITDGLRIRGVDVLTVQEDGRGGESDDSVLLGRATDLGRVLFSQDSDFLAEGVRRQRAGETFAGIIYAHQLRASIGQCVQDLELLAGVCNPDEFIDRVEFLPLK